MRSPGRLLDGLVLAWPPALGLLLLLPLMAHRGHPLARDLMFVPRQPWTDASIGLGDAAPRAVPLDALMSVATTVVDGGLVARVVLPLTLAAAGWGVQRLVWRAGRVARLAAGGFAVWNPFVAERLALGQWALLVGYAALPWVGYAAVRYRRRGGTACLGLLALPLAAAALTPTGGLLAGATAVTMAASRRVARMTVAAALVVAVQLPWLLPALLGPATQTSDPAGVTAFAPRAEGWGGAWVSLVGLGGIWDARSVPGSRSGALPLVAAGAVLAALVVAVPRLAQWWGRSDTVRAAVAGAGGLVLALAAATPWGSDALRWAVGTVPGAGLARDGQKLVAGFAVLAAAGAGAAVDRVVRASARRSGDLAALVGSVLVVAPFLLLPDATSRVWPTVDPVAYPSDFTRVVDVLGPGRHSERLVTLPWRSTRNFTWGHGLSSADPALRWFDREVVVSDDLQVSDRVVHGESRLAAKVGAALARGAPADVLPAEGVRWVLVYLDDRDAEAVDTTGLTEVYVGSTLALFRVEGAEAPDFPSASVRRLVLAVDLAGALGVLGLVALSVTGIRRRRRPGARAAGC